MRYTVPSPPPQPEQQQAPVGLLAILSHPQIMAHLAPQMPQLGQLAGLWQWMQQARQAADQNMIGRNWTPSLGSAMGMAGMKGPGTVNAAPPREGGSLGEMGLRFPESTVQTHVARAPAPKKMTEPIDAVKAADGLKGDAAEAMINQIMGIR